MSSMHVGGAKHAIVNAEHQGLGFDTFRTRTELAGQAIRNAWSEFADGAAHVAWLEQQVAELRQHHEIVEPAHGVDTSRTFARVADAITDSPEEADALQRQYDERRAASGVKEDQRG